MENQLPMNKNLQGKKSSMILVKVIIFLYLTAPIAICFLYILQNPNLLFWELTPTIIISIFFFIWGPLLMIVGGISYIAQMSNVLKISPSSSLYDTIMLPTIQCGPIKVILPATEEEVIVDENED